STSLSGTVMGVEKKKVPGGKGEPAEVEVLSLWCADGMRAVPLGQVQRVRFLNPALNDEVKKALDVLAQAHNTQKKTVSLHFVGEGKRRVKVGYVVENPMWKTSYRLVLDAKGKPTLQGWAVVENTTDEDWKDVRVSLIAGRPVSFRMNLYQPLYVHRPLVEPELFALLRPPAYEGDLGRYDERLRAWDKKTSEGFGKPGSGPGRPPGARALPLGDFFQYALEHPVTLPRHKSALVPILTKDVQGARVSVYNPRVQPKHPMLAVRLKNTSGLHLMQGPVTVFEGGSYAGDVYLKDLQPNEERLLAYAIDLGTEVLAESKAGPERLTAVRIDKGILYATSKVREGKTYTAVNRSPHDRVLVIEHPVRAGYHLVTPAKPSGRTRDHYRFEVKVPAGKSVPFEVVEEKPLTQEVRLTSSSDDTIRVFLASTVPSKAVKAALAKVVELKGQASATRREIAELERKLAVLEKDQKRLRANMERVPP